MGHNRLRRLPKSQSWVQVVALLDDPAGSPEEVAAQIARAVDMRLRQVSNDPGVGYSFWLLARIAWASRSDNFAGELARLGIDASLNTSSLQFISLVSDRARRELLTSHSSGDFAEYAALSLRNALTETIGQEGRSLFGTSLEDLQGAFRAYSTQRQFGALAQRFFSDFFTRTVRSYVERDIANHVGEGERFSSAGDAWGFVEALDLHSRQSARIVEEFAGSWYSKHNWETGGDISQEETQRFVGYALRKLRTELKQQVSA